ncbi:MAG: peptide-methionine (S)-S-oxide reductase MsrA [Kiritimatiellia bacterium]|jgi:peptide-methionine (S)-S-oxide reductase|nr:peptide-methionine (S)-S-oxide reductase MsrA [Kiritimatiellia bacterium]
MKSLLLALILIAAMSAKAQPGDTMNSATTTETATLAGGCFWCIEEFFRQQPGVLRVVSGYTGGQVENPTYAQVCSGRTGHAEAIQVEFDPQVISYRALLDIFWKVHDPTQLNQQGADVGTQYRSAIFTHSDEQFATAKASLEAENISGRHTRKIVTEIAPATIFHPAEDYHQEYYRRNRSAPYCRAVIRPKLKKFGWKE